MRREEIKLFKTILSFYLKTIIETFLFCLAKVKVKLHANVESEEFKPVNIRSNRGEKNSKKDSILLNKIMFRFLNIIHKLIHLLFIVSLLAL